MTDTLTPVLTANWDQPDSFTIEGYRRFGGYKALPKALAMEPDDVIATVKNSVLRGRGDPALQFVRLVLNAANAMNGFEKIAQFIASLAPLFRGLVAFFSTGARNLPV